MRVPRLLALGLSVALVASIVVIGAPDTALAAARVATDPPPPNLGLADTSSAVDYALSVRGQDIFQSQSDASKAAWTPELGRAAAQDANLYRAAVVYGNLDPVQLAQVLPMNKAVDESLNGKLTAGMEVSNTATTWKGTGFKFPTFSAASFASLRAVVGSPGGVLVALYAFEHRADIANGIVSWFGGDAQGNVCTDPVAGGANPINWITGQDCNAWAANQAFVANADKVPGVSGGTSCGTISGGVTECVTLNAQLGPKDWGAPGLHTIFVFKVTYSAGTVPSNPVVFTQKTGDILRANGLEDCTLTGQGGNQTFLTQCLAVGGVPSWEWNIDNRQTGDAAATMLKYAATATAAQQAPVNNDLNPPMHIQCMLHGPSGNVTNGNGPNFTEADLKAGTVPQSTLSPTCTPLPGNENPDHIVVTEVGGGENNVLYDKTPTSAATDYNSRYAGLCGTGSTQHTCLLDLITKSDGLTCFNKGDTCKDWFKDPNREADYQCQYGGQNEDMSQCYVYANLFDSAKRAAGDAYADPKTGDDPGAETSMSEDAKLMARTPQASDTPQRDCFGGGWGIINPLTWLRTGQCILEWAFDPSPAVVQNAVINVSTQWSQTPFAQVGTVAAQFEAVPVLNGCAGLPVDMTFTWPINWAIHWTFGGACTDPMKTAAAWVQGVLSALVYGGAGLALILYITGALGFPSFGRRKS